MEKQNKIHSKEVKLCPNCDGWGFVDKKEKLFNLITENILCPICDGLGRVLYNKIEWHEKLKLSDKEIKYGKFPW